MKFTSIKVIKNPNEGISDKLISENEIKSDKFTIK